MNLDLLVQIIHSSNRDDWKSRNTQAFDGLFGSPDGRFSAAAKQSVSLRAPAMDPESGVPFAAYIHPSNPTSGQYSGLSFVIFPVPQQPCLIGLLIGTSGLSPDEAILGRPGHARKVQAICEWLNQTAGTRVAWAKQDPTRTDLKVPDDVQHDWSEYKKVFDRYGKEMYALYRPTADSQATRKAAAALLDLMFEERGHRSLAGTQSEADELKSAWFDHLMPKVEASTVKDLLNRRRYVIVQGPPGTGKTKMAVDFLNNEYGGFGTSIQFHPNTTYENFVGGLAPVQTNAELGLRFTPTAGLLMEAAREAIRQPDRPYLLHIDEINRADLGKILGEAIFLLEPFSDAAREITLPYDFGEPFHRKFFLPKNLHILGTMNSADRSIGLVDIAVRRRFAFVSLWPRLSVVDAYGCRLMKEAFEKLVSHFVEHASDDAFQLVPGHSYFLETDEALARQSLKVNLAPLLEEYLAQGYVTGFGEQIRSYLQWLRAH